MTTQLEPETVAIARVELGVVQADRPADLVARATDAANALAQVIEAKGLYNNIQGRRFVKCEGWTTLATMMGCLPREAGMTRREDGSYEAVVELVRITDGAVLTRASAECGVDERTWASRPSYARRSMAATRATSKACRLAFSWVMALTGFEVTPSEEIPDDEHAKPQPSKRASVPLDQPPPALAEREPMPWEEVGISMTTIVPFSERQLTLSAMTKGQLMKAQLYVMEHPDVPHAEAWAALIKEAIKRKV